MLPATFKQDATSWVEAWQAIQRVPAWSSPENVDLYAAVIKQAPLWLACNTHEVAVRHYGKKVEWSHEDFERAFDEVGVPTPLREVFWNRQANRDTDYFKQSVGTDRHMYFTTWYIPFGFFTLPDQQASVPFPFSVDLIVQSLRELFGQLNPFIRLLEMVNDPLGMAPHPIFMNLKWLETLGWNPLPFCAWPHPDASTRSHFQNDPVHAGVLTLPLASESEEALGVLEDMLLVLLTEITKDGLGYYRFIGSPLPRHEAQEEAAVNKALLWAKLVMCSSAPYRGHAEFFFAKGSPNHLQTSVRVKSPQGLMVSQFTHSVSFRDPKNLSRILAPWMSPQSSHLSWQFSSAAATDFSDPRLTSAHPFW